jgi:alpha-beta hydrolase superfamily lysophospholipase
VSTAAVAAFARLGELELYYETQGTGPPLVLIHGSLMTASLMNHYPALLAAGRRVITVELQGHGHTRDIGRPLRYELLADDIAALLVADSDIVRLEHAVEMFHLLGGGVAGDIHGLPAARLTVVPGTTHTGLCDRAEWVVPMIAEFLGDAGG